MSHPSCPNLFMRLALAQRDLTNPPKDRTANVASTRGQYSYDYSDLATVLDTVRPVFSKHGLALLQWASVAVAGDGQLWGYITTVVSWSDGATGEWVCGTVGLPLMDTKPQTLGSLQTH